MATMEGAGGEGGGGGRGGGGGGRGGEGGGGGREVGGVARRDPFPVPGGVYIWDLKSQREKVWSCCRSICTIL